MIDTTSHTTPNGRRHYRTRQGWPAACSDHQGFTWHAWVVDYSDGGLGLDNCPTLRVDQVIEVHLENIGRFPCRVAWAAAARCGVEFLARAGEPCRDSFESLATTLQNARTTA